MNEPEKAEAEYRMTLYLARGGVSCDAGEEFCRRFESDEAAFAVYRERRTYYKAQGYTQVATELWCGERLVTSHQLYP